MLPVLSAAEASVDAQFVATAGLMLGAVLTIIGFVNTRFNQAQDAMNAVLHSVDDRLSKLERWHDLWANMPEGTDSAVQLDRRLNSMEIRLAHIEDYMQRRDEEWKRYVADRGRGRSEAGDGN